jgi:uncharacterized protein YjbJ (UPF0337 family)
LNQVDRIDVFVFALLATGDECLRRTRGSVFDFILQARNLWRNGNWLGAIRTRHSTVALDQFRDHLNLTKESASEGSRDYAPRTRSIDVPYGTPRPAVFQCFRQAPREKFNQSVHNGTELPPGSDYSLARKRTIADWLALGKIGVIRAWDYRRSFDRSLAARVFCISHNRRFHPHRPRRGPDLARAAFRKTRLSRRERQRRPQMKSSIVNRVEGEVHEVRGTIKEKMGRLTNDPKTQAEGFTEKVAGKIQKKIGRAQKFVAKR